MNDALVLTSLSQNTILGQTLAAVVFKRIPRVTNDSQLLLATPFHYRRWGNFPGWEWPLFDAWCFQGITPFVMCYSDKWRYAVNSQTLPLTVPAKSQVQSQSHTSDDVFSKAMSA